MQVTNRDIEAMAECLSDMFCGVTVSIDYVHTYQIYKTVDSEPAHRSNWRVYVHTPTLVGKEFKSWAELKAWAHAQDNDFSEQVMIIEA